MKKYNQKLSVSTYRFNPDPDENLSTQLAACAERFHLIIFWKYTPLAGRYNLIQSESGLRLLEKYPG